MTQRIALLGVCLALLSSPSQASTAAPNEQLDGILSPARPLRESEIQRPFVPKAQSFDKPSYTYVRCYYRQSQDPNLPASSYVWARDQASNDYYRLQGSWHAGGILPWQTMFFSDVSQQTLRQVCRQTLVAEAGGREPVLIAAANNAVSYNHTIWTLADQNAKPGLERMITFGDSLSDMQNMYAISQWKAPHNPTWFLGRFSNGPVWVEKLAAIVGLPLYNWAIGGAAGDMMMVLPGLRQQVTSWEEYTRADPGYRPERTLFTLWIGGNDLINYDRTAEKVIEDVHTALTQLITRGARYIVVLNLPDLASVPLAKARGNTEKLTHQVNTYNALLAALVEELRKTYGSRLILKLFDTYALFNEMMTNPARFQVENVRDSCLNISPDSTLPLPYLRKASPHPACVNANRYLFWDPLHPTAYTHKLLAEHVAEFMRTSISR